MKTSKLVHECMPPAIAEVRKMAKYLEKTGRKIIDMGQAVPNFFPPSDCIEHISTEFGKNETHLYTSDPGLLTLREAIADEFKKQHNIYIDPEKEILITNGANHAFFQALLTTIEPGQSVLVPSPYYFNHVMAMHMLGIRPIIWPMIIENNSFHLDIDFVKKNFNKTSSAVICINPNNPTGAVYPEDEIKNLVHWCSENGSILFYDEVYKALSFNTVKTIHPLEINGGKECTVIIGSFSKLFGMTGWRVGYLIAPQNVIAEMLKVQDTIIICAPTPSQILAECCLRKHSDFPIKQIPLLKKRAELLSNVISEIDTIEWIEPAGGIFTMIKHNSGISSKEMAISLLNSEGIVAIPGSAFGSEGEGFLRISFGWMEEKDINILKRRLKSFFSKK